MRRILAQKPPKNTDDGALIAGQKNTASPRKELSHHPDPARAPAKGRFVPQGPHHADQSAHRQGRAVLPSSDGAGTDQQPPSDRPHGRHYALSARARRADCRPSLRRDRPPWPPEDDSSRLPERKLRYSRGRRLTLQRAGVEAAGGPPDTPNVPRPRVASDNPPAGCRRPGHRRDASRT